MENSTSFTNPNSKIWLCSLLSYFINIKSIDDNIELIRISLCSQPNFSPYKLFNFLDKSSKGFILLNDLIIFLREMQIPFEEKYLRIFIHNFDKDADFSLNLNEFLGLILPKKNMDFSKNMKSTEKDDNTYDIININVKNIFGKLICEELELVKNCIKTAKSCKENTGFTLYEAFVEIAGTSRYICEQNLFDFFRKNNIDINKNDMHQLMFRLDADNDGKISFDEFQDIFFPIKGEEIVYKINNNNIPIDNNERISKKDDDKPKTENIEEKIEMNKINNFIDFTFARKSKVDSKKNIKTNIDYSNRLNKLLNYKNDEDLVKNKENKPINIDIHNNNIQTESIYTRTKYLIDSKNQPLFKSKLPPRIITQNQSPIPCLDPLIYTPIPKKYQFTYSSNPLLQKKNINKPNISSPYCPKRIKLQNKPGYQSPKTKHTKSPLHYDYSTYSDEDGDEYYEKRKLKVNKGAYTDKRVREMNDYKINKIFEGLDYKNNIRNNLEKMFLEDEKELEKIRFDIADIKKEKKIRNFNFVYNNNAEDDIKIINFDDIRIKNYKNEKLI